MDSGKKDKKRGILSVGDFTKMANLRKWEIWQESFKALAKTQMRSQRGESCQMAVK